MASVAASSAIVPGAMARIAKGDCAEPVVVQITTLEKTANGKIKVTLSDGSSSLQGVIASQLSDLVDQGLIKPGCTVRLNGYVLNMVGGSNVVMVSDLEVTGSAPLREIGLNTPQGSKAAGGKPIAGGNQMTPGPAPSPSEDPKHFKAAKTGAMSTPSGPGSGSGSGSGALALSPPGSAITPPRPSAPSASGGLIPMAPESKKAMHKLEQLHPYDDQWSIKVKVSRKSPLWTNKGPAKMVVELIDASGRQIQGTFWRGQAEKYHEALQVDRVYLISKFQVKVANKAYNSVNNDYEIHFGDKTEVFESPVQDIAGVTAAVEVVPFDQLLKHVSRKAPVDVLGVVVGLGQAGTIKRKTDNSEVSRRDVTLVDQGGKSVSLTLWGDLANQTPPGLEEWDQRCVVVQVTNCRVSDFNGCSLSALPKSVLTIDPETNASAALKSWFEALDEGQRAAQAFPPVGDAAAKGSGTGAPTGPRTVGYISDIVAASKALSLPSPDAKPSFQEVLACPSFIKTDQPLYYLAHPETGRKVVQQGDGSYFSENDGKVCQVPQPRYVFQFKLVDFSGELWANIFGAEAEALLGTTAEALAEAKDSDPDSLPSKIKAAQWEEWQVVLSSKTRDYNGERRMRHTVHSLKPVDWAKDSRRLLDLIAKY